MKTKISHNQRIKRLWPIVAGAGLLFAGVAQAGFGPVDLIANGGSEATAVTVGWVEGADITVDGVKKIQVTYQMTEPDWCLNDIHLAAASELAGIPQTKKGAPKIGGFAKLDPNGYANESLGCATSWTFTVDVPLVDGECNDSYVVAAHSVVTLPGDENNLAELLLNQTPNPDFCENGEIGDGQIQVYAGSNSYLDTSVWNNLFEPLGVYEGWCIDPNHIIVPGVVYSCKFYSGEDQSLWPSDPSLVQKPYNMDLVNWAINESFVGKVYAGTDSSCGGYYTKGDVQDGIWQLLSDHVDEHDVSLIPWEQCRADEIVALAFANGEGFVSDENGGLSGIICDTVNPQTCLAHAAQTTMFMFRTDRDETAWGQGVPFTDSTWAMYIEASCPVVPE